MHRGLHGRLLQVREELMKIIRKVIAALSVCLMFIGIPAIPAYAGSCHNADCGCRDYGINSCYVGMTCWYNDGDGCSGHSWYLYESTSATCTSGGELFINALFAQERESLQRHHLDMTGDLGHVLIQGST